MRTIGIITARGGSKGVLRKNARLLAGKPLIAYTIEAAIAARRLDRLIVTTDDVEIAAVGRHWGAEVPFMRPPELARDDTPTVPVLRHAMSVVEEGGDRFDAICLLQPTNPFRAATLIDECVGLLESSGADSVMSVAPVPETYNPCWVYFREDDGALRLSTGDVTPISRRQALPPAFHRDGSVYVVRRDVLMIEGSLYGKRTLGVVSESGATINIDTEMDWLRAEIEAGRRPKASSC